MIAPSRLADYPSPEILLAVVVLILALGAVRFRFRWLASWERPLARLARGKRLAILVAAAAPLAIRALLLPFYPSPSPRTHDEFSFLLAADTFAHACVVNPQHPRWVHFESMHILARPVYASAFPIGPAMAMAAGKVFCGHPWIGVWLSVGFMCGAICWMLQGWLPPRWALLGALLVALRLGVSSYWMNSYWGGSLAAAGGALALGALPRLVRRSNWKHAVAMGVGLAILAGSRPFEGAIFGLIVAVPLLPVVFRKPVILPLALVLLFTCLGMGYYFARVTGNPWTPPYVLYRTTMTMAPHFLWQAPRPQPLYNNREMQHFYVGLEMNQYLTARNSPVADLWSKAGAYWRFYLGPLLSIPLMTIFFLWRDRTARQVLLMAAAFSLALVGQVWHNPHYAAPATGLVILIVMMGLRRLRLWKRPVGLWLTRYLPAGCAAMLLIQIVAGRESSSQVVPGGWRWPEDDGVTRARLLAGLERSHDKHLVFVRYGVRHESGDEWVYNDANIDAARVVWARELDRISNEKLMQYFGDRRVWLVEPDSTSPQLVAYRDAPRRPMPFVQIGAPGIEVLQSADQLKRTLLARTEVRTNSKLSCDGWNYYFTEETGVLGPPVTNGCYSGTDRGQPVSFEQWFAWLLKQR